MFFPKMDPYGTVFYLAPQNKYAIEVVEDPANRERRYVHEDINKGNPILRIGLDQNLKSPSRFAIFGRRNHNDVIFSKSFSRNDQCYFDFNKESGELLLHDISEKKDTELCDVVETYQENEQFEVPGHPHIWKSHRQCVVVLSPDPYYDFNKPAIERKWFFIMRYAKFHLIPRKTPGDQDQAACTEQRLAFAGQHDPEKSYEGTLQRLITLGLRSEALSSSIQPSAII